MQFIFEWYKAFLALGIAITGAGCLAWLRGTFVTKKSFDEKHSEIYQRISTIEQTIDDLPSASDVHHLDKKLVEVSGKIDALSPQLTDIKRITDLLMENELRGNRNGHN